MQVSSSEESESEHDDQPPTTMEGVIAVAYPEGTRCTSRLLFGIGDFSAVLASRKFTAEEVVLASFAWETVVHAPGEFYSTRLGRMLLEIQNAFVAERNVRPEAVQLWYGRPRELKPGLHQVREYSVPPTMPIPLLSHTAIPAYA